MYAYSYVGGNPLNIVDANGEFGSPVEAIAWGMTSGAIGGVGYGALAGGGIGGIVSYFKGDGFWSGFRKGALTGAIAGGITGIAFGGIHGAVMNWGSNPVYVGAKGMGLEFLDLTIALPNTMAGATVSGIDYIGGLLSGLKPSVVRFKNQGMVVTNGLISSGLSKSKTTALAVGGPYVLGAKEINIFKSQLRNITGKGLTDFVGVQDLVHEFEHVAQQRRLGPLMPLLYRGQDFYRAMKFFMKNNLSLKDNLKLAYKLNSLENAAGAAGSDYSKILELLHP